MPDFSTIGICPFTSDSNGFGQFLEAQPVRMRNYADEMHTSLRRDEYITGRRLTALLLL